MVKNSYDVALVVGTRPNFIKAAPLVKYFESNNLDSMIKKINHVIQNYNEATSVGINAKEFILSNYSSDNFKFSFKKIFDTV